MLYAFNAARHHTLLIMHASVVALQKQAGYLFLGKKRHGQSTHTGLWLQQFSDCHLLNDDNPMVHVDSLGKINHCFRFSSRRKDTLLSERIPDRRRLRPAWNKHRRMK